MKYIYKIGNLTIFANKCVLNGMTMSKDGEIESASFSNDTVIRVLKPGDMFPATMNKSN